LVERLRTNGLAIRRKDMQATAVRFIEAIVIPPQRKAARKNTTLRGNIAAFARELKARINPRRIWAPRAAVPILIFINKAATRYTKPATHRSGLARCNPFNARDVFKNNV
jgi:hypothetical protein